MSHHDHAHGHAHPHAPATGTLRAAFFLNLSFTLVELVGGLWTNSFAVLSDALHDLGDCLVLGTAWYLQRVALKGRDAHYSYGYARHSMLGGWGSAWFYSSVPRSFSRRPSGGCCSRRCPIPKA
ncbi:MAG: cation transporter [Flavobacteriales bacterium]|nr:cation transporter [Flavobacteriales bacterium]